MLAIQPFSPEHRDAVAPFILGVQHEFGVPITLADQPDLVNIEETYIAPGGHFWLAFDGGTLVGTAALFKVDEHNLIMRKLFVDPAYRGAPHQLGKKLLDTMMAWAAGNHFRAIYLGTVAVFEGACRFYEKHGFTHLTEAQLPDAIRQRKMKVDDTFYMIEMAA